MREYTITYDDGITKVSGQLPAPERLPQPGDVYEFTKTVLTLANVRYGCGDRLEIIERTNEIPHYRLSSLGNLRVKCKFFTSVWTNIEAIVERGSLRLVDTKEK
jgi:hypothetical protein